MAVAASSSAPAQLVPVEKEKGKEMEKEKEKEVKAEKQSTPKVSETTEGETVSETNTDGAEATADGENVAEEISAEQQQLVRFSSFFFFLFLFLPFSKAIFSNQIH